MSSSVRALLPRGIVWFSALVLLAGLVAFFTVKLAGDDSPQASQVPPTVVGDDFDPGPSTPPAKDGDVPRAARVAAGEFVLAAVGREDLPKAWKLAHPTLKRDCGCTYEQWLTGDIPVQYYPTAKLAGVTFAVNEAGPQNVVLEVLLSTTDGSTPDQAFYVGLKPVGKGTAKRWLVDYFAPLGGPPVPQVP